MNKKEILECDRIANGFKRKIPIPFWDYNWIYLKRMRAVEFHEGKNGYHKIAYIFSKFLLQQISVKTGIQIPAGTFGTGLTLYHWGSIVVNDTVIGGAFVTIQSATNISRNVTIEDNVYIAPGVKILENVHIAEGVIIGANSVVTKSIDEPYTTWIGIPARKLKNVGFKNRSYILNEVINPINNTEQ